MIIDNGKLNFSPFNNINTLFDDMCKYGLKIDKFERGIDAIWNNYYVLHVTIPYRYDIGFFKCFTCMKNNFIIDIINNIKKTLDSATIKTGEHVIVFYKTDLNKYWEQNDYEISLLTKRDKTDEENKFYDFLEGLSK